MKTPCCIESVNKCPNTSSCSMILRSACSHGHSHKSLTRNDVHTQNSEKKRILARKSTDDSDVKISDSKSSFQFESILESSIKHIALQSTKTFSIWKENLYNHLEFSDSQKKEVFEQNGKNLKSVSEHHFIKTSTPISSLHVKDNLISSKEFIGNAHSSESIESSTATMSGSLNLPRKALRALSESDTDEESSSENRVKLRRTTRSSNSVSHNNSSVTSAEASTKEYRSSNHVKSNNFASTAVNSVFPADYYGRPPIGDRSVLNQRSFSVNSSQIDLSTVHESAFHRLRWIIWRYIYLKMISIISFDVWLLSRLRGSRKALFILLLPLLLYILYSTMIQEDEFTHKPCQITNSSLLSSFISSLYSFVAKPFTYSQKLFEVSTKDFFSIHSLLPSFSAISGYFSSLFVKTEEKTSYFVHRTSTSPKEASPAPFVESLSKEQVESLVVKVLEERLNDLEQKIQVSNTRDLQDVKGGTAQLQKEISDLRHEFKSLSTLLLQFQNDIQKLETSSAKDVENLSKEHKMNINLLNTKVKAFEEKLDSLGTLKRCCDKKIDPADFIASIEKHLVAAFRSVVDGDKNSYHFFSQWLNSKFTDPKALSSEINLVFERLKKEQPAEEKQDSNQLKIIEGIVHHYLDSLKANMTLSSHHQGFLRGSLTSEDVRRIVREAILLYDADKTGLVDYALESAGGSVLSTRCSESYTEKKATLSLLGLLPLWSVQNTPRTAIQPDVQPGQCWSFKGSQGFLVIQLSYTVHPTGFTLEHIPVSLSPTGSIDSAPKDFSVWGLSSEADNEGTILGKYSYDDKGEPLQYFAVQNFTKEPFSYVELKIHNNHGHLEYTCLYRFRVHGTRVK